MDFLPVFVKYEPPLPFNYQLGKDSLRRNLSSITYNIILTMIIIIYLLQPPCHFDVGFGGFLVEESVAKAYLPFYFVSLQFDF